ncbi:MAG: hypothetical protein AABZ30_11965 [Myxococcota bacterium]
MSGLAAGLAVWMVVTVRSGQPHMIVVPPPLPPPPQVADAHQAATGSPRSAAGSPQSAAAKGKHRNHPDAFPWTSHKLGDEAVAIARKLWLAEDDVKVLVDDHGRLAKGTREKLEAGAKAGTELGRKLGLDAGQSSQLGNAFARYLVRQVTMRRSVPPKVTTEIVDATVLEDIAREIEVSFGPKVALASKPGLLSLARLPL